MHDYLMGFILF